MRKYIQSNSCFLLCFVVLSQLLTSPATRAGEISVIKSLSFGTIDFYPGGDTITISALTGSASPQAARSIVTGGGSGLIRITSETEEHVDITYPESVILRSDNHTMTLINIDDLSQYSTIGATVPGDGSALDIHIGGRLIFTGDEIDGSYSGSLSITLNFE